MQVDRDEFERVMKVINDAQEELDELLPVADDIDAQRPVTVTIDREWLDRWDRATTRRDAAEKDLVALLRGAVRMRLRQE